MTEVYLKTGISSRKLDTSDVSVLCFDRGVLTHKKSLSEISPRGICCASDGNRTIYVYQLVMRLTSGITSGK